MKLSGLTILMIGISIFLVAIGFAYFQHWTPNKKEQGYYEGLKQQLEIENAKESAVKKRVKDAEALVAEQSEKWSAVVAAKTPSDSVATGGIDITVDGWHLVNDTRKFRNNMQRAFNAQVKKGGVTVINGPAVPESDFGATSILASYYNYPAIPFPVVMVDFGTITVRGTYDQIVANMRSWASMPNYLAVADGLQLTGTSPYLEGTYSLSMVAFIRGSEVFPVVPEAGAGAGGAGNGQQPQANNPAPGNTTAAQNGAGPQKGMTRGR